MTMKIGNCLSYKPLGAVLALACMILAGEAAAKAENYNFGLKQVRSECAGTSRFNAYMSFTPGPKAKEYTVSSGNACYLGGVKCGGTKPYCTVPCNGPGACTFDLKQCQQGHGTPWIKVWVPGIYDAPTAAIAAPRTPCP
jgi:hypothetical protein